ncbi:hypothetical protein [Armatimonas sp.]|uniref:hypothetical protein n=1 Tax=Armatimonas sp. TaxID=1872638 RepID=UPI0037506E41
MTLAPLPIGNGLVWEPFLLTLDRYAALCEQLAPQYMPSNPPHTIVTPEAWELWQRQTA